MKIPVYLDFLEGNQAVAALEDRARQLAYTAAPDDNVTARCVADCLSAAISLRAAFRMDEGQLDAACAAAMAEMVELKDAEFGDAPLADWAPGEISEAYGR